MSTIEVIFSKRAFASMVAEVIEHPETETGGILLGQKIRQDISSPTSKEVWIVQEITDPGYDAVLRPSYFEYSHRYCQHLSQKLSRLYKNNLVILGLYHKHPRGVGSFSSQDRETHDLFLEMLPEGILSGLVFDFENFQLDLYHISKTGYQTVTYKVDDNLIDLEQSAVIGLEEFNQIKEIRKSKKSNLKDKKKCISTFKNIQDLMQRLLSSVISDVVYTKPKALSEIGVERILCALESDLNVLTNNGYDYELKMSSRGTLHLKLEEQIIEFYERVGAVFMNFSSSSKNEICCVMYEDGFISRFLDDQSALAERSESNEFKTCSKFDRF